MSFPVNVKWFTELIISDSPANFNRMRKIPPLKKGIAAKTMPHYIKQPMKIQYLFKCLARAGNTRRIVI